MIRTPQRRINMAIPDYESIMLPLLRFAGDGKEHSAKEAAQALAVEFALSESELKQLLPSGRQTTFGNRIGWAGTYLKKAGLLQSSRRGIFQITARGLQLLAEKPIQLNSASLHRFPGFVEFIEARKGKAAIPSDDDPINRETPEEVIEAAYQRIRQDLASELLQTIKNCSATFFERLVVDLIVKMGYGGTRKDAGEAIGKSGDEGIDGIIKEDRLGLDIVYIQAKRWDSQVGRPEVQKFAGALQGQRAKKGIFLTTSAFTKEARDYVSRIESKIVLIDGDLLAQLMIDFNIGVAAVASYELKRIDSDYFTEE